jgi:hypothetical protein
MIENGGGGGGGGGWHVNIVDDCLFVARKIKLRELRAFAELRYFCLLYYLPNPKLAGICFVYKRRFDRVLLASAPG